MWLMGLWLVGDVWRERGVESLTRFVAYVMAVA